MTSPGLNRWTEGRVCQQPGMQAWRAVGKTNGGQQQKRGGWQQWQDHTDETQQKCRCTCADQEVSPCICSEFHGVMDSLEGTVCLP